MEVERHSGILRSAVCFLSCGDGGNSLPHPPFNFYFLKKKKISRELVSPELAMWDILKVLDIEIVLVHKYSESVFEYLKDEAA